MKFYIVKESFKDLNTNHVYNVNNLYPFDFSKIEKKRIEELSSDKNKLNKILIEEKDIKDLETNQLMQYITSKNIDVKECLINAIIDFNKSNKKTKSGE